MTGRRGAPAAGAPIITLTTDFGTSDHFVGAMKGVILSINPAAAVIDITHKIQRGNVPQAAFCLHHCFGLYPEGTIHVCVVDPGVGTARRPLLISSPRYRFVLPDNGICTGIIRDTADAEIFEITASRYFREEVSRTFHGRDIFAPVAAWLSMDRPPSDFGKRITDPLTFKWPRARVAEEGPVAGEIVYIDHFGNLITSIHRDDLPRGLEEPGRMPVEIKMGDRIIRRFGETYASVGPGEFLGLIGSTGFVEISANQASAEKMLGAAVGDAVEISMAGP
jgi:S-adenosylmethionine hydrolase